MAGTLASCLCLLWATAAAAEAGPSVMRDLVSLRQQIQQLAHQRSTTSLEKADDADKSGGEDKAGGEEASAEEDPGTAGVDPEAGAEDCGPKCRQIKRQVARQEKRFKHRGGNGPNDDKTEYDYDTHTLREDNDFTWSGAQIPQGMNAKEAECCHFFYEHSDFNCESDLNLYIDQANLAKDASVDPKFKKCEGFCVPCEDEKWRWDDAADHADEYKEHHDKAAEDKKEAMDHADEVNGAEGGDVAPEAQGTGAVEN